MRSIEWTEKAWDDLERLSPKLQDRILASISRFASSGVGDVKRLIDLVMSRVFGSVIGVCDSKPMTKPG